MSTQHKTITIGIPVYNEAENISELLRVLVEQKTKAGEVQEILVISDGSSDDTVKRASEIHDSRITIVDRKERLGLNYTQNEIMERARGDILVIFNGDVLPVGNNFIEEIVMPICIDSQVGLVGADTVSADPHGWLERIAAYGHELRIRIYRAISDNNVYLCHGRARAFSRALYTQLRWPHECPEDSYSYLFAISKGFKFVYLKNTQVIFRSPTTFYDYAKQNQRFARGKQLLTNYFSSEFVKVKFKIPVRAIAYASVSYALFHPMRSMSYGILFSITRLFFREPIADDIKHDISPTTKKIIL